MARVIVRVSLEGTGNAQPRLTKLLEKRGFALTGTATREAVLPNVSDAYDAVREVLDFVEAEQVKFPLDHLWLYISK